MSVCLFKKWCKNEYIYIYNVSYTWEINQDPNEVLNPNLSSRVWSWTFFIWIEVQSFMAKCLKLACKDRSCRIDCVCSELSEMPEQSEKIFNICTQWCWAWHIAMYSCTIWDQRDDGNAISSHDTCDLSVTLSPHESWVVRQNPLLLVKAPPSRIYTGSGILSLWLAS